MVAAVKGLAATVARMQNQLSDIATRTVALEAKVRPLHPLTHPYTPFLTLTLLAHPYTPLQHPATPP